MEPLRKTSRAVVDRFRFDQAIARARAEFREDGWAMPPVLAHPTCVHGVAGIGLTYLQYTNCTDLEKQYFID